jgi:hypothetical protein
MAWHPLGQNVQVFLYHTQYKLGMVLQEKPLEGVQRADNSIFHGWLLHAFHLWGELKLQPPPPAFINCFIGIGTRLSWFGTWKMQWPLSVANTGTSTLRETHVNSTPLPACDLGSWPNAYPIWYFGISHFGGFHLAWPQSPDTWYAKWPCSDRRSDILCNRRMRLLAMGAFPLDLLRYDLSLWPWAQLMGVLGVATCSSSWMV